MIKLLAFRFLVLIFPLSWWTFPCVFRRRGESSALGGFPDLKQLAREEQTGTSSDGVAVSGDESPESVRRFSRSANPKGLPPLLPLPVNIL